MCEYDFIKYLLKKKLSNRNSLCCLIYGKKNIFSLNKILNCIQLFYVNNRVPTYSPRYLLIT